MAGRRNDMAEKRDWIGRLEKASDRLWRVVSPERALRRASARMAYDAIDGSRTRKKRADTGGTADKHLTDTSLDGLREIHREMMRNNPLIVGLLDLELDEVIGDEYPKIQALTGDEGWNQTAEAIWKEEMIQRPCDVTGRFKVNQLMGMAYQSYRRDGDHLLIFTDDGPQCVEGDCIGTPFKINPTNYTISNGMAFSKQTNRFLGCYVGSPSHGGYYIDPASYRKYEAKDIHVVINPKRTSQSRGEPALSSAITKIDQLDKYIDAYLILAHIQACWGMYITIKDSGKVPAAYINGSSSSGEDSDGNKLVKVEPGTINYLEPGEEPHGMGMTCPAPVFDSYVTRMLSFICAPLAIPIMMALGDYSSATFMNARFAYMRAQSRWKREQSWVISPMASRIWRWFIDRSIASGVLTDREDRYSHSVQCRRWPYVDPRVEAEANQTELENGTTTRRAIIEAKGIDYQEHLAQREKEKTDFASDQATDQSEDDKETQDEEAK